MTHSLTCVFVMSFCNKLDKEHGQFKHASNHDMHIPIMCNSQHRLVANSHSQISRLSSSHECVLQSHIHSFSFSPIEAAPE